MHKIFFAIFGLLAVPITASASSTILINEIAWMGSTASANHEWIELYNQSDETIDLTGWTLKAADGTPTILLYGSIDGGGYYLLERTNDDTVPNIPADLIYTGALGNTGEDLELIDNNGNIIDSIYSSTTNWLAGDNITKQTMERIGPTSWLTSLMPNGTPKSKNSTIVEEIPADDEDGNGEENQGDGDESADGLDDNTGNDPENDENNEQLSSRCHQKIIIIGKKINKQISGEIICERINQHQHKIQQQAKILAEQLKNKITKLIKK